MSVLAVIIGRAGSKGFPGKNIQLLSGKPLVAWTIEHVLACRKVDDVALSSDGQAILEIGRPYPKVKVFDRPAELAHDTATVDAAVRHGVSQWEHLTNRRCDIVAILYANVPLRPADLTDRAIDKLQATGADSVQCVYRVGKMHPLWMRKLTGQQSDVLEPYQPNEIYRRQDLPPVYMLSSGVIAVTRASLFDVDPAHPHQFLGTDRRAIVHEQDEVVDIDTPLDLRIAQAILDVNPRQGAFEASGLAEEEEEGGG